MQVLAINFVHKIRVLECLPHTVTWSLAIAPCLLSLMGLRCHYICILVPLRILFECPTGGFFRMGLGSCRGYLARQVESHACSKFARGDTICISLIVVSDTRNTLCRRFVHDEWEHVFSEARRKQGSVAKKNPNMFRSLCHQEYT